MFFVVVLVTDVFARTLTLVFWHFESKTHTLEAFKRKLKNDPPKEKRKGQIRVFREREREKKSNSQIIPHAVQYFP